MLGDEALAQHSLRHRARALWQTIGPDEVQATTSQLEALKGALAAETERRFGPGNREPSAVLSSAAAPTVAAALGLECPAALVDGACASGLLVIDVAIKALLDSDLDLVIAISTMGNMGVPGNVSFAKIGGLSPDGSRPLAKDANGLIPGEGAGAFVLKALPRAIADGDRIYGVIRGVATRSDGAGKAIYAPSTRGQVAAMRAALRQARATSEDIDYLETHATGTPTGDSTEIESIVQLLQEDARTSPLVLGSGKSLIGHGFPSAGAANLLKILLSFEHEQFLPTFAADSPNPLITTHNDTLQIATAKEGWPTPLDRPRRALANAFGFGGVNSCVVVEQYSPPYHDPLAQGAAATRPEPGREALDCLAVVGASAMLPGLPARPGLPDQEEFRLARLGFEGGDPDAAKALDFALPSNRIRIPPSVLKQTDRSQQFVLAVALSALSDAGLLNARTAQDPDRIATVIGAASGLEMALERNERIRAVEYHDLVDAAAATCALPEDARSRCHDVISSYLSGGSGPTTEAALPGYMDNIVAGRAGNCFDLRGTNYVIDADFASFAAALRSARLILQNNESDAVLVGATNALTAPDVVDLWSRQVGAQLRPVEAAVALVVQRPTDLRAGQRVYGYIQVEDPTVGAQGAKVDAFTAFAADGALWVAEQLAGLRSANLGGDALRAETIMGSAFSSLGYPVKVGSTPQFAAVPELVRSAAETERATGDARSTAQTEGPWRIVGLEARNLDEVARRLPTLTDLPTSSTDGAPPPEGSHGRFRLVFAVSDDADTQSKIDCIKQVLRSS
jgi:3-oxoacyl-(acyl-carrier-protein) synthase